MDKLTRRTAALMLAAGAISCAVPPAAFAQSSSDTIKIGVLTIDSGPFATYASLVEDSARTAVDILNAQGGALGKKFEVVLQSHAGTPASAIAAATRLVQQAARASSRARRPRPTRSRSRPASASSMR